MYANLSTMHRTVCAKYGPRTALRYKEHGRYRDISWTDYRRQTDWAAAGLIEAGIQPGDRVGILSENRYEWLEADHAILSCGAADVPMHAPLAPKQIEYQVAHSEARAVVVSGQDQADKIYKVLDALPSVELIISFDPITPRSDDVRHVTWEGLKHRGRQAGADAAAEVLRRESAVAEDDLATIIYTSGTTGNPKGVMLSHGNLIFNATATLKSSQYGAEDVLLSWLPYSHIYARTVDHYVTTLSASTVCLADSVDTLVLNLREIRPSWITAVPRFYEKVWNSVEHLEPAVRKAALWGIFGANIRQLSSGGAPLPRHVCEGFFEAGFPMLEGYGLTESSPVISFNTLEANRIGSVGRPIEGVEVKIADDGEILARGPNIMKGYWKNDEATAETIRDGWLMTGDVGQIDEDGYLTITDRKKDLFVTSSGKNVAPSEIERLLVSDPFIEQAVIYGDGRQFISALIVPAQPNLDAKLKELGVTSQPDGNFIKTPAILDFYEGRVKRLMEAVSQPERVKRFLLMARPFELASDELTATLKVRRRHVIGKYEKELAALYES